MIAGGSLRGTLWWTSIAFSIMGPGMGETPPDPAVPSLLRLTLAELLLVVSLLIVLGAFQLHSLECLRGPPYVQDIALSPDGSMLLLAIEDGTALFDVGTGRALHRFGGPVYGVAFSPDGRRAALADHERTIRIVDTDSGRTLSTDRHHLGSFSHLCILSRHGRLATANEEGVVRLWSLETGEVLGTLQSGIRPLHALAYDPVDGLLVAGGNHAQVWDIVTMERRATLRGHDGGHMCTLAFSPDGRWLVAGMRQSGARVWDVQSGSQVVALDDPGCLGVAFSGDGQRLALTDRDRTSIWRTGSWNREATLQDQRAYVNAMRLVDNGETLVTASKGGLVQVWDPASGRERRALDVTPPPEAVPRGILASLAVWAVLWLAADRRRRRVRSGDLQGRDAGVYLLLVASAVYLVNGLALQALVWRPGTVGSIVILTAGVGVLICMTLVFVTFGMTLRFRRRLIFTLPSLLILGGAFAYDAWFLAQRTA
jgi:WD40 repeat protein